MPEVTAEVLFDKLLAEKATGELLPLAADFYTEAEKYAALLSNSAGAGAEAANVQKMLLQLKEKRKQKLLVYLAFGRPLPKPVPNEEETLYNEILKIISSGNEVKVTKIKILVNLPEIITSEGKKIGPFKSGDVIEVTDSKDAAFIVSNKIGEKV
ncbi:MAG: hypothetical protein QXT43_02225 [Candidatus Micrarchaeaceae archaeon]